MNTELEELRQKIKDDFQKAQEDAILRAELQVEVIDRYSVDELQVLQEMIQESLAIPE